VQGNLVANGGFIQSGNPLAGWSLAPGALATWQADGANGTNGSVQLRFLPAAPGQVANRGAIYYTGLFQCVSLPGPGDYRLGAHARVDAQASAASFGDVLWSLHPAGAPCAGAGTTGGRVGMPRSTAWIAGSTALRIEPMDWVPGSALRIELAVGDSSTVSIEPVEAEVDEVTLLEGPMFADGFDEPAVSVPAPGRRLP
jgi:hypothetical protein